MSPLRLLAESDFPAVIAVFQDAVSQIAVKDYTEDQLRAWLEAVNDRDRFRQTLNQGTVLVAEDERGIVAFGQLDPYEHVNLLYCCARGRGKGFAAAILAELEVVAKRHQVTQIHTEASLTARPFFEKYGYVAIAQEIVVRNGIKIPRLRMEKQLCCI